MEKEAKSDISTGANKQMQRKEAIIDKTFQKCTHS
jgi:hypothetical protein